MAGRHPKKSVRPLPQSEPVTSFTDMEFYSAEESDRFIPDGIFKDGWIHELGPQERSPPGASLDSEVFWKTFDDCSTKLPKNVAAVFNLRAAQHFRKQFVSDAASHPHGVGSLPGDELICEAECVRMKIFDSLKTRWIVWMGNHTPNCAEMSRLVSRSLEQPLSMCMWLKRRLHYLITHGANAISRTCGFSMKPRRTVAALSGLQSRTR
ncbi:MAG: hypothetical protein HY043_12795 [Verrucomicrobia bacterium]|nr:hypothetical protein [Verrucomicrobiota bacterium]